MYETAHKKLGSNLRRLRTANGFSQEGFAQAAHIERARYGRMERGELNVSLKVIFSLCKQLSVTPSELLENISLSDLLNDADEAMIELSDQK